MDLTNAIGKRRVKEQDAARILVILFELGAPAPDPDDHCMLETEVYLQKVDYLVRCPADLAYVLLDRFESQPDYLSRRNEIAALVRRLVIDREPKLRTMGMQKFRFGPWERLDDILTFLACYDFVRVRPRSGQGGGLVYYVTKKGAALVQKLYKEWPELGYYRDKCEIIRSFLGDVRGTALKDYLYDVLERIQGTKLGRVIPSHGDLVAPRFRTVMGEDL
ncbi:hypothetical protein JQX13_07265 [Archangium violaceum]|uniref:hypothetical protein n=1 Tax=Archangium violaceum TaxID=83451 RepID=UPI00193C04A7|nr:hypothetical protein [Archangium violaceum]QRK09897.1 hypothetical protein JQX13_07265 [Archangium violaceum]